MLVFPSEIILLDKLQCLVYLESLLFCSSTVQLNSILLALKITLCAWNVSEQTSHQGWHSPRDPAACALLQSHCLPFSMRGLHLPPAALKTSIKLLANGFQTHFKKQYTESTFFPKSYICLELQLGRHRNNTSKSHQQALTSLTRNLSTVAPPRVDLPSQLKQELPADALS